MTKKERTIKACRELAAKYREPEGKQFFVADHCFLCRIHWDWVNEVGMARGHAGCPLADVGGVIGCYDFSSAATARTAAIESMGDPQKLVRHKDLEAIAPAFDARAAFFDKIIPILEEIPASRFTKRGWKYFDELDRSW